MSYNFSIVAILSTAELSLGSYLHLMRIPFTGQLMSLNQCFWLNVSKCWSPEDSALKISLEVAAIKAMSPFGKRLTPMLAIGMQGLLFETGCFLGGSYLPGRLAGSILISLWALLQPMLTYSLFLGTSLYDLIDFFSKKMGVNMVWGICCLLLFKIAATASTCLLASYLSKPMIEQYGLWIQSLETKLRLKSKKKIFRTPFFISFTLINIYLYYTADSIEYFLRQSLFYFCWMSAVFYFMNFIEKHLFSNFISKHQQAGL